MMIIFGQKIKRKNEVFKAEVGFSMGMVSTFL